MVVEACLQRWVIRGTSRVSHLRSSVPSRLLCPGECSDLWMGQSNSCSSQGERQLPTGSKPICCAERHRTLMPCPDEGARPAGLSAKDLTIVIPTLVSWARGVIHLLVGHCASGVLADGAAGLQKEGNIV